MRILHFDNLSKFPQIKHFVGTRHDKSNLSDYVTVKQVHGDNVLVVKSSSVGEVKADAMITNQRGIGLVIRVADCVPIMFYDPTKNAIGIAHAGWRGTLKKIVAKTVAKMRDEFETNPEDLVIGIGPSICVKHYEVDEAVLFGAKGHFDLRAANKIQLEKLGVKNIEIMPYCTYERTDLFYSYRREGKKGMITTGILITG
jgi:hypothetical protein